MWYKRERGTYGKQRIPYYSLKDHVAGKTGTAEVESARTQIQRDLVSQLYPVEQPQMALAVVLEKVGISGEAVEVARGIWKKPSYCTLSYSNSRNNKRPEA